MSTKHTQGPWRVGDGVGGGGGGGGGGMSAKHTPGPWSVKESPESSYGDHNKVYIGKTYINVDGEANAKLIAAAPELFEALQRATEFLRANYAITDMPDILVPCIDALAKAGL